MKSAVIQAAIGEGLLDRLPVTFSAFFFDQIKNWELLFPAEQSYFERLVKLLQRSEAEASARLFAPLRSVEAKMNLPPALWGGREFTLDHVDFLNRSPHYAEWRKAVAAVFAELDPLLDAEVARSGKPRLVIVLAPAEIPMEPSRMWTRIERYGRRVPVEPPEDLGDYVRLSGDLLQRCAEANGAYSTWAVEAGEDFGGLSGPVRLSYAALEAYRTKLMAEVDRVVQSEQIRGPRQLGARLKQIKASAGGDVLLSEFTRAVLLNGNGTLLINNTFVEWASVQAIRRARPSMLVASFGIRNKMKPFSNLLIYTDQDKANPIPSQMDVLGTAVDLEVLYQYIWQETGKYAEYRLNTVFLFLVQGADQMLCIAPPDFALMSRPGPVVLGEIFSAAGEWLSLRESAG